MNTNNNQAVDVALANHLMNEAKKYDYIYKAVSSPAVALMIIEQGLSLEEASKLGLR